MASTECVTDKILRSTLNTELRKDFCCVGPDHRPLDIIEECASGRKRWKKAFQEKWYDRFPWLTASVTINTVLCFQCLLFGNDSGIWRTSGPASLVKFTSRAVKHENSRSHIENSFSMRRFMRDTPIDVLIDEQKEIEVSRYNQQVSENRKYIQRLTDAVVYLGTHEIAFRGHSERLDDSYRGNYIDLLMYTSNLDPAMQAYLNDNKIFKGTSMHIQNDLIRAVADVVRQKIREEICHSDFVSIQVDEASDLVSKEYLSIVVRYHLSGVPVERFLGFFPVKNRDAESIFEIVKCAISSFEFEAKKIVGVTCDGASVMSGRVNGFCAKMRTLNPSILFTHCHAHRLNLVVTDSLKSDEVLKIFFTSLSHFRTYFHRSTKRTSVLDDCLKESKHKQHRIASVPETRWSYGSRSVSTIIDLHEVLVQCLSYIIKNFNDESVCLAEGLLLKLCDKQFMFLCVLWKKIFLILDVLSNICQKVETDVLKCY